MTLVLAMGCSRKPAAASATADLVRRAADGDARARAHLEAIERSRSQ